MDLLYGTSENSTVATTFITRNSVCMWTAQRVSQNETIGLEQQSALRDPVFTSSHNPLDRLT